MTIVNIHDAKTNLSALIQQALNGEEVIIAKNNNPIITLKPIPKKGKKRKAGILKGKIKILEDWNKADKEIEGLMINNKFSPDE